MKKPRMSCAARKQIPASTMVSDICSSISLPCTEISTGGPPDVQHNGNGRSDCNDYDRDRK